MSTRVKHVMYGVIALSSSAVSTLGQDWSLAGNSISSGDFLGTTNSQDLLFKVNGQTCCVIHEFSVDGGYAFNIMFGSPSNSITSGVQGGTISGGGGPGENVNKVTDSNCTIGGGSANIAGDDTGTTTSAVGATVGGGWSNVAELAGATVAGGSECYALGQYSTVGGGDTNTASGKYCFVGGGYVNTASGNPTEYSCSTVGGGYLNTASGVAGTVAGGWENTASGDYAIVAGGIGAVASLHGQSAHAAGYFSNAGDAQTGLYVLRASTTNGNATEMSLNGQTGAGIARLTIASGRTVAFEIQVAARSSTGDSAGYRATGVVENVSGTTAIVDVVGSTTTAEDVSAWGISVTADNTNDALVVTVTGAASTNIHWVATVKTTEVAY